MRLRFEHAVRVSYWPSWAAHAYRPACHRDDIFKTCYAEGGKRIASGWCDAFGNWTDCQCPWRKEDAELAVAAAARSRRVMRGSPTGDRSADRTATKQRFTMLGPSTESRELALNGKAPRPRSFCNGKRARRGNTTKAGASNSGTVRKQRVRRERPNGIPRGRLKRHGQWPKSRVARAFRRHLPSTVQPLFKL